MRSDLLHIARQCGLVTFFSLCSAVPASAAVIYGQAPAAGGASYESSIDFGLHNADTFHLTTGATVDTLEWWGTQADDADGFNVRLFDSLGGSAAAVFECGYSFSSSPCPAAVTSIAAETAGGAALLDLDDRTTFKFSLTGLNISLAAGTNYVFSVAYEPEQWFWLTSDDGDGISYFRGDDADPWSDDSPDMAFSVVGTAVTPPNGVPEPSTLALLGLAVGALTARRARK